MVHNFWWSTTSPAICYDENNVRVILPFLAQPELLIWLIWTSLLANCELYIPYRTKFRLTKVPKIWLSAENYVRQKILSAENFVCRNIKKKPIKFSRRTKLPKFRTGAENYDRGKFFHRNFVVENLFQLLRKT